MKLSLLISFSPYITEIQGHRHGPFPQNLKKRTFCGFPWSHGRIWLDTNSYPKLYFYESHETMKEFLSLLIEATVNKQEKITVTPLWLEKLLSQNSSLYHEFYSWNEFTSNWVLQQDWFLYHTLFTGTAASAQAWETTAQLLSPHILTSRWQPSPNVFELNNMKMRLKCYLLCYIPQKHFRLNENLHRKWVVKIRIVYKLTTLFPKKVKVGHSEF